MFDAFLGPLFYSIRKGVIDVTVFDFVIADHEYDIPQSCIGGEIPV